MNTKTLFTAFTLMTCLLLGSCKDQESTNPEIGFSGCRLQQWTFFNNELLTVSYDENNRISGYTEDDLWNTQVSYDKQGRVSRVQDFARGELSYEYIWSYTGGDKIPNKVQQTIKNGESDIDKPYRSFENDGSRITSMVIFRKEGGDPASRELFTYVGSKLIEVRVEKYDTEVNRFYYSNKHDEFTYDAKGSPMVDNFWYLIYGDIELLPFGNNITSYRYNGSDWKFAYTYNVNDLPETQSATYDGRAGDIRTFGYFCQD